MTVALDRLTANDLMMLWPDDFGCPQDIGALAVLDGRDLLDETGAFRIEAVRMEVERRLHLVPRLRQRLFLPGFGRGLPLWVDDQAFDVAQHVRAIAVPAPAGEQQLLQTVERLRAKRIDRSRPPWELWFLTGLPNDDVGMYFRLHHAVADGMMGVALVGAFLDQPAGQHAPDPPP